MQDKELTVRQRYWLEHVNDRPDDLRDQISTLFEQLLDGFKWIKTQISARAGVTQWIVIYINLMIQTLRIEGL